MIRLLVSHGADVNQKTFNDATPLMFAAAFDQADAATLLLELHADPTSRDLNGQTALDLALAVRDPALIQALSVPQ